VIMMGNAIKTAPSATVQVNKKKDGDLPQPTKQSPLTPQHTDPIRPTCHHIRTQVSRAGVALSGTGLTYNPGETLSLSASGWSGGKQPSFGICMPAPQRINVATTIARIRPVRLRRAFNPTLPSFRFYHGYTQRSPGRPPTAGGSRPPPAARAAAPSPPPPSSRCQPTGSPSPSGRATRAGRRRCTLPRRSR
jgi:hypothetical protein